MSKNRIKKCIKQKILNKISWIINPINVEIENIKQLNLSNYKELKDNYDSLEKEKCKYEEKIFQIESKLEDKEYRISEFEKLLSRYYDENIIDRKFIVCFYKCFLNRVPSEDEVDHYLTRFKEGNLNIRDMFIGFVSSEEYDKKHISKVESKANTTYSQSGEDSIIRYLIAQLNLNISTLTYLDIGANDPIIDNNTYRLYTLGAHGVLIEANKDLVSKLKNIRSRDIVINKCISDKSEKLTKFYIMNYNGLSSSDEEFIKNVCRENGNANIVKTVEVESITFEDVINKYFTDVPNIVSIDIEGKELEVLKSIDFNKYRPNIFIIENTPYNKLIKYSREENDIVKFMDKKGYKEYAFTGINSIFIEDIKDN